VIRTLPRGGENELGVVDQIIDHLAEAGNHFFGRHQCALAALEFEADRHPPSAPLRTSFAMVTTVVSSLGTSTASVLRRCNFRVEPARIRNIGDQAVEPLHVVLDHLQQAGRGWRSVLASGSVSTAERMEVSGFFSSWADIGREALDRPRCGCRGASVICRAAPPTGRRSRRGAW